MRNNRRNAFIIIKLLIVTGVLFFLYFKLKDQDLSYDLLLTGLKHAASDYPYQIGIVILLMPLNWSIEAFKWKLLAQKVIHLQWTRALEGVLTGLSLSFITPYGLGDYLGRIMILKNEERGKLTGAIFLGRFCQMMITLLLGLFGISYFIDFWWTIWLTFISLLITLIFIKSRLLSSSVVWRIVPSKVVYYLDVIRSFSSKEIINVFMLSFFRYLVFALQLIILLLVFNDGLSIWSSVQGTTWMFLAKTVIPTFNFLGDLGIREFSAVYFFETQSVKLPMVILATLLLWIINILFPTLVGTPLVFKLKMTSK